MIPSGGCHRRIRRELLLCVISGELLNHPGLTGFPTLSTLHPIGLVSMIRPDVTRLLAAHRLAVLCYSAAAQWTSDPQVALPDAPVQPTQGQRVIIEFLPWSLVDSMVASSTTVTATFRSGASAKLITPSL